MPETDLSIIIRTILQSTESDTKSQLAEIQRAVDKQGSIKVPFEFNQAANETGKAAEKIKDIFGSTAQRISEKFSAAFSINDKKTLAELSKLTAEYIKAADDISKANISNEMFERAYAAIKKFESSLTDAQREYKEFVDHVNGSRIKMQPFGADYEDLRRSFGVGVISSKSGVPMDIWYQEARESFSHILPDIANVEDQFEHLAAILKYGRENLRANKITDEEIQAWFGGETGIRDTLNNILQDISSATQDITQSINSVGVNIDKSKLSSLTEIWRGAAEEGRQAAKIISEQRDDFGSSISVIQELDSETNRYLTTQTRITENYRAQMQALDALNAGKKKLLNSIDIEVSKAFYNTAKPIKLDENISRVKEEAENLKKVISEIYDKAADENRSLFRSEAAELDNLIKNYKNLIGIMQTQERAATKLRTKTVEEIMGTELESLAVLENKMRINRAATDELTASFEKLKASVENVKTNEQFVDYSVRKDLLEANINAEISSKKLVERQNKEAESVSNLLERIRVFGAEKDRLLNADGNGRLKSEFESIAQN